MLSIMLIAFLSAFTSDFGQNGIYYNITSETNRTVEVTQGEHSYFYSGDIEIPKKIIFNNKSYTITSIGDWAFNNCRNLTSVIIPNSVTSIGEGAFCDCSSLTSGAIPSSISSIGAYAFSGCNGLTSVIIHNSVTSIGEGAFSSCNNLETITVQSDNTVYCSWDGILYNKEMTVLICCPCKKISLTIPSSISSIGAYAFCGCRDLTSVIIPNTVTYIGRSAFEGCRSLTSVSTGNTVISIGEEAFCNCRNLTSVSIGHSVTYIGESAFKGCNSLETIYSKIVKPFECSPRFSDYQLKYAVLYVPTGTLVAYEKVDPWRNFWNIEEIDYSGVHGVESDGDSKTEVERYNLQGLEVDSGYKGLIIIRYSDGSYCKMYAK